MGRSFCPNCWKEFETAGPELHAPDCQYMLIQAYYIADKLGYVTKDSETASFADRARPFFEGRDEPED